MSGPLFQAVAARSRRRSGLLSRIARSCDAILIVPQISPCSATRSLSQLRRRAISNPTKKKNHRELFPLSIDEAPDDVGRELQGEPNPNRPMAPEKYRPPQYNDTCIFIKQGMGLRRYQDIETHNLLFGDADQEFYTTQYETCNAYDIKNAALGYWANMKGTYLGTAWSAASAFAILAVIFSSVATILLWCSMCVAFGRNFFPAMSLLLVVAGVFEWLSLSFFASDVCEDGCTWSSGASFAIAGGIILCIASGFAFVTGNAKKGRALKCGCCPNDDEVLYMGVPTNVSVTETLQKDGSTTIEEITTRPDGTECRVVTTMKKVVASDHQSLGKGSVEGVTDDIKLTVSERAGDETKEED